MDTRASAAVQAVSSISADTSAPRPSENRAAIGTSTPFGKIVCDGFSFLEHCIETKFEWRSNCRLAKFFYMQKVAEPKKLEPKWLRINRFQIQYGPRNN